MSRFGHIQLHGEISDRIKKKTTEKRLFTFDRRVIILIKNSINKL